MVVGTFFDYVAYHVSVSLLTADKSAPAPTYIVYRRFSDFKALQVPSCFWGGGGHELEEINGVRDASCAVRDYL